MRFDGTLIRGTATYGAGKFNNGRTAGVWGIAGVDSYLSSTGANGGTLNQIGTVEAWFKLTATSGQPRVIAGHESWWYLAVDDATDRVRLACGASTIYSTSAVKDGNLHHAAATWTSGTLSLYLDGNREATLTTTFTAGSGATQAAIAGLSAATLYDFPGTIDEVRYSSLARYTGTTYTVPTAEFTPDAHTIGLYHLESDAANSAARGAFFGF